MLIPYTNAEICDMAKVSAKKGGYSTPPENMNDIDKILFCQIFYLTKSLMNGEISKENATKLKNQYISQHESYALTLKTLWLHTKRTPFINLAFNHGKKAGCKWCARAEKIFDGRLTAENLGNMEWEDEV